MVRLRVTRSVCSYKVAASPKRLIAVSTLHRRWDATTNELLLRDLAGSAVMLSFARLDARCRYGTAFARCEGSVWPSARSVIPTALLLYKKPARTSRFSGCSLQSGMMISRAR